MADGLQGFTDSMNALRNMKHLGNRKMQLMLERAIREIANYAKQNGPWEDRTGNLRNSIGVNYPLMKAWQASPEEIAELKAMIPEYMTPVLEQDGSTVWGYVYAGMDYAVYVERLDGYWVLEGAINHYRPLLEKIFKKELTFKPGEI